MTICHKMVKIGKVTVVIMIVGKWNYEKNDYDPHELSDDWYTPMYSDNLDEIINCSNCGRKVRYGDCYTSRWIHDRFGLGFLVCEQCYDEEWERQ